MVQGNSPSPRRSRKHRSKGDDRQRDRSGTSTRPPVYIWTVVVVPLVASLAIFVRQFNWEELQLRLLRKSVKSIADLAELVCQEGYCHQSIVSDGRTRLAAARLESGQYVAEIPRHFQIWDVDALNDTEVQTLYPARHELTENPLDSRAFLAAYLALLAHRTNLDIRIKRYLDTLPTLEDFAYHPIRWKEEERERLLGKHSAAYLVVKAYETMIQSEYQAFAKASPKFAEKIWEDHYTEKRLAVLTRSLQLETYDEEYGDFASLVHEQVGIDITQASYAMVPLLDLNNHHAHPNVKYGVRHGNIVARTIQSIPKGHEILVNYGVVSDTHLFAKYGFVNGDGSDATQAILSLWHRQLDPGLRREYSFLSFEEGANQYVKKLQRQAMLGYLQFDDGYEECISNVSSPSFLLKRLKLEHLVNLANRPEAWAVKAPERNEHAKTPASTRQALQLEAPSFDIQKNLKFDSQALATCRLMAMNDNDFGGKAAQVLRDNLYNSSFLVTEDSDALEFRALMCVGRLVKMITDNLFETTVEEEIQRVEELNRDEAMWNTKERMAAHVRLGEIQTLEALRLLVVTGAQAAKDKLNTEPDYLLRSQPCKDEDQGLLLKAELKVREKAENEAQEESLTEGANEEEEQGEVRESQESSPEESELTGAPEPQEVEAAAEQVVEPKQEHPTESKEASEPRQVATVELQAKEHVHEQSEDVTEPQTVRTEQEQSHESVVEPEQTHLAESEEATEPQRVETIEERSRERVNEPVRSEETPEPQQGDMFEERVEATADGTEQENQVDPEAEPEQVETVKERVEETVDELEHPNRESGGLSGEQENGHPIHSADESNERS